MSEGQDNGINIDNAADKQLAADPQKWLENLQQNFAQFDNSTLQIYAGSAKVYEQVGHEVTVNKLSGDVAQKVQQALLTPEELKGSVQIKLDGEKVFHAKQGEILENKLPLAQIAETQSVTAKQGVEPEIQAETKLENQPKTVAVQPEVLPAVRKEISQPEFVPQSWDDIRNLIAENQQKPELADNAIFQLLAYQSQQLNSLQQKLDAMEKMKPPLNAQVAQFFSSLKDTAANSLQEVKQFAQQFPQDIKQFLGNKATDIQQAVGERVNAIKQDAIDKVDDLKVTVVNQVNATSQAAIDKVDDLKVTVVNQVNATSQAAIGKVEEFKDSVDRSLADVSAKALDNATRWVVNKFGKDPDGTGTKVWQGNDYSFTASSQNTSILNKSGQEIALDGKLTPAATGQDASKLANLPQDVQQIAHKLQHQQKPTSAVNLKR